MFDVLRVIVSAETDTLVVSLQCCVLLCMSENGYPLLRYYSSALFVEIMQLKSPAYPVVSDDVHKRDVLERNTTF